MANELKLDNPLARDIKPVKINDEVTSLQLGDDIVRIEKDLEVGGDISIEGGDLNFNNVNTEQINLGSSTTIQAETTDLLSIESTGLVVSGIQQTDQTAVGIITQSGQDSKYALYNGATLRWTLGNDADDSNKLKIDSDNLTVGGNTKLTLDSSGNLTVTGNVVSSAGTLGAGGASALNDLSDVTYSSGDLTISSLDKIIADDFVIDSGASIELDSNNGNFVAKKAGTEFSVANSAYAGTILGYRLIGESHTHTSYTMTNSFAVPDSDMTVRFIAPPSGNVEYEVQAYLDVASNLSAYFGLSDNATYNTVGATYEHLVHKPDESDQNTVTWKVVETGLTAGSTYNRWFGAKVSSGTTSKIFYGGTATNRYADFIFKVTALPTAVSDFAVYD